MPGTEIPVIRQPYREGDLLPPCSANARIGDHSLFDLRDNPNEESNLRDVLLEKQTSELLSEALREVEAPEEQFVSLGLS